MNFGRDTVASVGLISRELPFTESNTAIKTFRHAVSLDECRVKFRPRLLQIPHLRDKEQITRRDEEDAADSAQRQIWQQRARKGRKGSNASASSATIPGGFPPLNWRVNLLDDCA